MHYTVTLTRPAWRDTLSHLPAPRLRQAGPMGEGRGEGPVWRIQPIRQGIQAPTSSARPHACYFAHGPFGFALPGRTSFSAATCPRSTMLNVRFSS